MNIALAELAQTEYFNYLKIIAGRNGLWRPIESCGWLDYEFEKILKNRYIYSNFSKNQLVITTFLFAKDNSFLTRDAIRHLIEIDAGGLVVNNVFGLTIPDSILRYADTKEFPVFEVTSQPFDMAAFTISVTDYIRDLAMADFGDKEIGALLHSPTTRDGVRSSAFRMNPSFLPQITALYMRKEGVLGDDEYVDLVSAYRQSALYDHRNALYRFQNGLMYIISDDAIEEKATKGYIERLVETITGSSADYSSGLSDLHYDLSELDRAMQEAIYAAMGNRGASESLTRYSDLGSYQAILPLADQPAMIEYSAKVTEPLVEYDASCNTSLLDTLLRYVSCEGNLHELARVMSQHENTLRYRFTQIEKITGKNPIRSGDYEQLALAAKIIISRKMMW